MARNKIIASTGKKIASFERRTTLNPKVARRSFLKLSAATAALTGVAMTARMTVKATAVTAKEPYAGSEKIRTICTYCAVGCGIEAEVQNGVWVRQEIALDHPVSPWGALLQRCRSD